MLDKLVKFSFFLILFWGFNSCAVISFDKVKGAQNRTDSLNSVIDSYKIKLSKAQEKVAKYERDSIHNANRFQQLESKMKSFQTQVEGYKTDAPSQLNLLLDDLEGRESVLRLMTDLQDKRFNLLQELNQEIQGLINGEGNDLIKAQLKSDAIEITFTDTILVKTDDTGTLALHKPTLPLMVHIADRIRKNPSVYSEVIGNVDASTNKNKFNDWQRAAVNASLVTDYLVDKALVPNNAIVALSLGGSIPVASNEFPPGRKLNRRVIWKIYAYKKEFEKVFESALKN